MWAVRTAGGGIGEKGLNRSSQGWCFYLWEPASLPVPLAWNAEIVHAEYSVQQVLQTYGLVPVISVVADKVCYQYLWKSNICQHASWIIDL